MPRDTEVKGSTIRPVKWAVPRDEVWFWAFVKAVGGVGADATVPIAPEGVADFVATLQSKLDEAVGALEFYGDPGVYTAIAIFADPPCGAFGEDFSDDHGDEDYPLAVERDGRLDYSTGVLRPMPGKRARATLARLKGEG